MATTKVLDRCPRCGTIIRSNRAACPSCEQDLTLGRTPPPAQTFLDEAPKAPTPSARVKKAICQACMSSVPESEIEEYKGSRMCRNCAELIRSRTSKKS